MNFVDPTVRLGIAQLSSKSRVIVGALSAASDTRQRLQGAFG